MLRLLCAAVLTVAAVMPAVAGSWTGYRGTGEIYLGAGRNYGDDSDVEDQQPYFYGLRSEIYVPHGANTSFHADFFFENGFDALQSYETFDPSDQDETEYLSGGGAVHFNYQRAQRFRLGGALGIFGGTVLNESDVTYGLIAAEGTFYFDNAVWWAQAGYFDNFNECHICYQRWWHEVMYVRGGINYFLDADLKLGAELGMFQGYVEGQDQSPLSRFVLELESRCSDDFSAFASYRHDYFANEDEDDPLTQHVVSIGVRVRWGEGETSTLREQENYRSIGTPNVLGLVAVSDEFD